MIILFVAICLVVVIVSMQNAAKKRRRAALQSNATQFIAAHRSQIEARKAELQRQQERAIVDAAARAELTKRR